MNNSVDKFVPLTYRLRCDTLELDFVCLADTKNKVRMICPLLFFNARWGMEDHPHQIPEWKERRGLLWLCWGVSS